MEFNNYNIRTVHKVLFPYLFYSYIPFGEDSTCTVPNPGLLYLLSAMRNIRISPPEAHNH